MASTAPDSLVHAPVQDSDGDEADRLRSHDVRRNALLDEGERLFRLASLNKAKARLRCLKARKPLVGSNRLQQRVPSSGFQDAAPAQRTAAPLHGWDIARWW